MKGGEGPISVVESHRKPLAVSVSVVGYEGMEMGLSEQVVK